MSGETRLRAVVLLALAGFFVSLYMLLYHLGYYGQLVCGIGSCDTVQASKYARFLGAPVPLWGTAWYAAVAVLGLLGAGAGGGRPWVGRLLGVAATGGLLFSVYLTAIELLVIHAVCMWCVVSAVITVLIFLLAEPWRLARRASAEPAT